MFSNGFRSIRYTFVELFKIPGCGVRYCTVDPVVAEQVGEVFNNSWAFAL